MKQNLLFILFLVLFVASSAVKAEVKLPAIFGDGMVLQQQSDAAFWGTASANKTVTVITSWNNKRYSTKADSDGKWKLKVKTPTAGGPFSVSISDGKTLKINDVLIGEVWVCSGQSNMQMPMKGYMNEPVLESNKIIAASTNKNIRLITIERAKSLTPNNDFSGEWKDCTPANVADFSAAAYFFGKMIQETLDVPVGLICSSWGGTRIEPWMSENGFQKYDWVNLPDKNSTDEFNQQTPTVLFNAMISPMVGYAIRGGLWYQGESNRNEPAEYEKLMSGLVENWRAEWGIGEFPFYYCQIAPFKYGNGLNSAFLREAQLNASSALQNIGMACLMDVGEAHCIHPAEKQAAGERLAYFALAKTYNMDGFAYSGPVLKEMTIEGSIAKLTFDHAKNGLTTFGKELKNFTIAGENKRFYQAQATITRKGVSVSSPMVENPVAVRYAFENFVVGELFNTEGLPASSFRTDNWEIK
uniref:sialate O-acetylesterase n=1 Tax=uncultured Draconibacterium sp. TaxID=1573823 RepID=UPI003217A23E